MSAFCIAIALWLLLTLLVFRVRVIAELAGAAVLILIALAVAAHFRSARGAEPPWLPGAQWLNPAAPEIKPIQPGPVQCPAGREPNAVGRCVDDCWVACRRVQIARPGRSLASGRVYAA
jgi:hypothetical protein